MQPPGGPSLLLEVEDLSIELETFRGHALVVDRVGFTIDRAEVVAIVGESGSGKSLTAMSTLRLLPRGASVASGRISFAGEEILAKSEAEMQAFRGRSIAMIFQTSLLLLNPLMRIGDQIARVMVVHKQIDRSTARTRAIEMLSRVGIRQPARVARSYPHELSGGMLQRALIALMMAAQPRLLIADEPTTGLDATTAVQIFDLLHELRRETDLSILLITHDLGTVAENSDRVAIMHAGHIVESGSTREIFNGPQHPYTRALLASLLTLDYSPGSEPALRGQAPDVFAFTGDACRFVSRCPAAMDICSRARPPVVVSNSGHMVFCHLYGDVDASVGQRSE
jgi:oligopeptide/dipeptide ABC transporter ATP-binding protein